MKEEGSRAVAEGLTELREICGALDLSPGSAVDIIRSVRSTGSLLKPFLYAPMLDSGELLPEQLVADIPTSIGGFQPENSAKTYEGAVPANVVLARSLNVPAVRLLRSFGGDRFAEALRGRSGTSRTCTRVSPAERESDRSTPNLSLIFPEQTIFWHMDGEYLGETTELHDREARPGPGAHTLTLVDDTGEELVRTFTCLSEK